MKIVIFVLATLFVAACSPALTDFNTENKNSQEENIYYGNVDTRKQAVHERPMQMLDDGTKYLVHPTELEDGGPGKDGIPSIDDPVFESVSQANEWLQPDDQVLVVTHNDITRAYPLPILVWHEIVNDEFGKEPIIVTYCPLCGSGVAYKSTVNKTSLEFGVSGKLFNSNLVMYDRQTDSYWSQVQGRAIVGEYTGTLLEQIPSNIIFWKDWKVAFPEAEVLSRQTGADRQYGYDPYGEYYTSEHIFFPVQHQKAGIFPKATVYGVVINDVHKAYLQEALELNSTTQDTVADVPLTITRDSIGIVSIVRADTGEIVPFETEFWFAWYAFHPKTEVFASLHKT